MAKLGPITLKVNVQGPEAVVGVSYEIQFDEHDRESNRVYEEECRIIGDDTHANDPAALAAPDDTLGFLTPLFNRNIKSDGEAKRVREFSKAFRTAALNEDRGPVPNPDEIRARVTLTAMTDGGTEVRRESRMVKLKL